MPKTLSSEESAGPTEVKVQLMPFDMDYDGKADIEEYFETTLRRDVPDKAPSEDDDEKIRIDTKNSNVNASFRGRLLNGRQIAVPETYQVCCCFHMSSPSRFS